MIPDSAGSLASAGRWPTPPLVLEFVGLPGAGKTTLARLVMECLAAEGYRCRAPRFGGPATAERTGRVRRAGEVAASYCADWRLAASVLRFGVAIRPLRPRRAKWLRELLDFTRTIRVVGPEYDLIILDQAFLQAIWSATVHGTLPPTPLIERLIHQATSAAEARVALLHLIVDPEIALERIAGRQSGRSRFDRLSQGEGAALLRSLQGRLGQIVDCAARATRAPVLLLDGSAPLPDLCAKVTDFVADALYRESIG